MPKRERYHAANGGAGRVRSSLDDVNVIIMNNSGFCAIGKEARVAGMVGTGNLHELRPDLTVPVDDGACDHVGGMRVLSVCLNSMVGRMGDLAILPGKSLLYCYPRTGRPDVEPPRGYNEIPGPRGCTPQSCAIRDDFKELQALGAGVFRPRDERLLSNLTVPQSSLGR